MKIEMHSHIGGSSVESRVYPVDYIAALKSHGYEGIVTTDKFSSNEFRGFGAVGLRGGCKRWLKGYRDMKEAAEGSGIKVFLGMEYQLEHSEGYVDILLYGLTEEVVLSGEIRPYLNLKELNRVCSENGLIAIQAHPYKYGDDKLPNVSVDGFEVLNTGSESGDWNENIQNYVKLCNTPLIAIGGGDCKKIFDVGKTGIDTFERIETNAELKMALRQDKYSIIGLDKNWPNK